MAYPLETSHSIKLKLFAWRSLHNRIHTAAQLHSMAIMDSPLCTLCHQQPQTTDHSFSHCQVTKHIRSLFPRSIQKPTTYLSFPMRFWSVSSHHHRHQGITVSWYIWRMRNAHITTSIFPIAVKYKTLHVFFNRTHCQHHFFPRHCSRSPT